MAKGSLKFFGGPWDGCVHPGFRECDLPDVLHYTFASVEWGREYAVDTRAALLSIVRRPHHALPVYRRVSKWTFEWKA